MKGDSGAELFLIGLAVSGAATALVTMTVMWIGLDARHDKTAVDLHDLCVKVGTLDSVMCDAIHHMEMRTLGTEITLCPVRTQFPELVDCLLMRDVSSVGPAAK